MTNQITITFLAGLVSGDTIDFSYYGNYPTDLTPFSRNEDVVNTRVNPGETSTGSTANAQAANYYSAFTEDYGSNFNVTINGNVVTIIPNNNSPIFSASSTSNNVIFDVTTPLYIEDVRARSPYLLISTGTTAQTFTSSVFTISQFEGSIFDYTIQPISYQKTKAKITQNQNNIWINIAELVREDLEADISYYSDADYTTARNLSLNESKWVYINTVNQYLDTGISTGDTFYFVTDGYVEPSETQGLPNLLLTGDKRYLYRGSNERLYFKTDNLTGATYSTPTTGPTNIDFTGDTEYNYGYVKSVKIDIPLTEDSVTYTFGYSGQTPQSVTYYIYDECKYDNYDLVFKNKYGVLETLSMSKKSSKTLLTDSNNYTKSIVDIEGNYNINRHTKKQFNVTGTEEWTLNTDLLPEYMNAPIKESKLSEEMWLIDNIGNIIPVINMDSNIDFKTLLNDKMVQYTIKLGLSHSTVQNII